MNDYMQQLFPYIPESRLTTLSCGHVIPASNLFVGNVVKGHAGAEFDFTFPSRNSVSMMLNLGESLLHLLPRILDGVVLFFPSYGYLDQVVATWKRAEVGKPSVWSRLEELKPAFLDSQSATLDADDVLSRYSSTINASGGQGALLLSVIGGKLSEGINFSDRLGRCVMVVGLPYPNPNSPEWKARMDYIGHKAVANNVAPGTASREYSENVCMRAVNQAIGRAVRHKDDWAAILLFDRRYEQARIQSKLPMWVQASLSRTTGGGFAAVNKGLEDFFGGKAHKF